MIRILDRYLLVRFIVSLVVALGAIMLIALIIDVIENLEDIVDHAASPLDVVKYYVYFLPWIYKIVCPAAVLLAGLFSVGIMARSNEVLAMKAAGLSLYRIALPILIFAFFLSIFNFFFNEEILPEATRERERIKHGTIERRDDSRGKVMYNLSKQGEGGYIYHFDLFRPERSEARGALVQRFERDSLRESYRGERMVYLNGFWTIYDGIYRDFTDKSEGFIRFDSLVITGAMEKPDEFEKYQGKPEDMGYRELAGYIEVLKKTGAEYTRELVDLKIKISFPFTSFIVVFLSIPLASNPRRSGVAVSFAIASAISLFYFVIFKVTQSLGYSGTLSPDVAAWSINVIFLVIGLFVFFGSHK